MSRSNFTCYDYISLAICSLGYTLGFTYRGSLSPITDALQDDLNTTASGIGLLSTSLFIGAVFITIPSGLLLEIYSSTLLLAVSWFAFGLCSILFCFASNLTLLNVIQFGAGIFIGPLFLGAVSDAHIRFGNKHLAVTIALINGLSYCGVLIGGVIQAFLFDEFTVWRHFFFGLGALSVACSFIIGMLRIAEFNHVKHKIDESKQCEMIVSKSIDDTQALLFTLKPTSNSLHFFIFRQCAEDIAESSKIKQSWNSLKIVIQNYANWLVGIHGFCLGALLLGLNGLWFIPYLMEKFNYSRSFATIINGLFYISSAFGGIVLGKIVSFYPNKRKMIVILCSLTNACSIIIIYGTNKSTHLMIVIILNCASGLTALFSITFALLREYNTKQCGDTATGFAASIGTAAGLVVPFVIGELMDYSWEKRGANDFVNQTKERHYNEDVYNFGFLVLPFCLIIQIIVSCLLKRPQNAF